MANDIKYQINVQIADNTVTTSPSARPTRNGSSPR